MKIKFLFDCIGRETAMKQYHKDDIAEFPLAQAMQIIRLGGAEIIEDEEEPQEEYQEVES